MKVRSKRVPTAHFRFKNKKMFIKCKVRIVNTLTHQSDTLEVPVEETVEEIQNRYIDFFKNRI